jgi:hypothetical protein
MFSRMTAGLLASPAGALQAAARDEGRSSALDFLVSSDAVDGRDQVRAGECRWKAVQALIFTCAAALLAGCTSDAASICERLQECDLLPAEFSVDDCENDVARDLPDEQQADCAACLERKACDEAIAECSQDCAPR